MDKWKMTEGQREREICIERSRQRNLCRKDIDGLLHAPAALCLTGASIRSARGIDDHIDTCWWRGCSRQWLVPHFSFPYMRTSSFVILHPPSSHPPSHLSFLLNSFSGQSWQSLSVSLYLWETTTWSQPVIYNCQQCSQGHNLMSDCDGHVQEGSGSYNWISL